MRLHDCRGASCVLHLTRRVQTKSYNKTMVDDDKRVIASTLMTEQAIDLHGFRVRKYTLVNSPFFPHRD
jgi:hypothetical protein